MNSNDVDGNAQDPTGPPASHAVSVTLQPWHDGRLPVTVMVSPTADLDAPGGVFVDFRKGVRLTQVSGSPVELYDPERALAARDEPITIAQGDAAVAAMAAREATVAAAPHVPAADVVPSAQSAPSAPGDAEAPPKGKRRQPLVSHQIAKACHLTIGQSETFRGEVALVQDEAANQGWYVRGRFATKGGRDLLSAWMPVGM